ncbi:MAG: acyltransferase family protein [Actinomycetaceae bacterium]|nr:acyltransferase family protein [Actinomycetaceae bacterium]MDU0969724.1 acyltransferase family protein [Actinomycetaceae bacterium]
MAGTPSTSTTQAHTRNFRPELHGLRALCICQVMCFHAWGIGTPLAVDVFVILSSFLLTSSFLKRFERGITPNLFERWMHFFKRLMPPVVITVGATLILMVVFLPQNRWPGIVQQAWAVIFLYQNWLLSSQAVDYFAAHTEGVSPLMHLWYVAIQGQVYLVVPAILILLFLLTKKSKKAIRPVVAAVFGIIAVVLFVWTVINVNTKGTSAIYFDTRSRAWEFALGCVIAAARPLAQKLNVNVAAAAEWAGLLALIYLGTNRHDNYPGPLALVTVCGAGAIMLWGDHAASWSPTRFLSLKPFQWLGDRFFGIYLVHWPVIAVYMAVRQVTTLGIYEGLILLLVGVALASLLTEWVDNPVHYSPWVNKNMWTKAAVVATALAVGAAGTGAAQAKVNRLSAEIDLGSDSYPGAKALDPNYTPTSQYPPAQPKGALLTKQWVSLPEKCTGLFANAPTLDTTEHHATCGQYTPEKNPVATVVAIGDSHMEQYSGGWMEVAEDRHWTLALEMLGACPFTSPEKSRYAECADHNRERLQWLLDAHPDAVIMVVTESHPDRPDTAVEGIDEVIKPLADAGITVVGLRDNPRFDSSPYECTQREGTDRGHLTGCVTPASYSYAQIMPDKQLRHVSGYVPIDTSSLICPDGLCWSIIGNVYVYLDNNHLTKVYSQTLADYFNKAMPPIGDE